MGPDPAERGLTMRFHFRTSPNQNSRPSSAVVSCIVLHATEDEGNPLGAIQEVMNAATKKSYHAIVERDGSIDILVSPDRRADHAGVSSFGGVSNVNDFSLGLAFANRNDGREPYPEPQLVSAAALVNVWRESYPAIGLDRITTHAIVALPPGRKDDPTPPFDLASFLTLVQGA